MARKPQSREARRSGPREVRTSFTDREGRRVAADLTYDVAGDRVELIGIAIRGGYRCPITKRLLTDFPVRLVDEHRPSWASLMRRVADAMPTETLRDRAHRELDQHQDASRRRVGRPAIPLEELQRVADIYIRAWRGGSRTPTKAVREKLDLTAAQAAKRVQMARTRKLIPPTQRRTAGWHSNPTPSAPPDDLERVDWWGPNYTDSYTNESISGDDSYYYE